MPRTIAELEEQWLAFHAQSRPRAGACVTQLCVRPELNQRAFPSALELNVERGAVGDRWERRTWMYLPDGRPDPRVQVALMDQRILTFLQELTGCTHHPGDTLLVDLDLQESRLPRGARLHIGTAIIEISDVENDGCAKFATHYGSDVLAWIRASENRPRRLRGAFARIIQTGTVRTGDPVEATIL